jgi:8-oxo-dGTP diphosphatase
MPRLRVAAWVREGDSLLLVRHRKAAETYWLLPGGGVRHGEALDEALRREMYEETRLSVSVGPLVLLNDSIDPKGTRHMVQAVFACEVNSGAPSVGEDPRVDEVRYVPAAELAELPIRPDLRTELLSGLTNGFGNGSVYVGRRWLSGS